MGVENNPQFMFYETSSSDEDKGRVNLNQVYNNWFHEKRENQDHFI